MYNCITMIKLMKSEKRKILMKMFKQKKKTEMNENIKSSWKKIYGQFSSNKHGVLLWFYLLYLPASFAMCFHFFLFHDNILSCGPFYFIFFCLVILQIFFLISNEWNSEHMHLKLGSLFIILFWQFFICKIQFCLF